MRKDSITQAKAIELRKHQTDAEQIIWNFVRADQLGHKFKRQQPIDSYIVDFVCFDKKLIIEIDGGQHTAEKDKERTSYLESQGFQILRFWNNDVIGNRKGVYQVLVEALS